MVGYFSGKKIERDYDVHPDNHATGSVTIILFISEMVQIR